MQPQIAIVVRFSRLCLDLNNECGVIIRHSGIVHLCRVYDCNINACTTSLMIIPKILYNVARVNNLGGTSSAWPM